jgi:phosphatidate cytidylyltransferase
VSVEAGLAPSPGRQDLRNRLLTAILLGPLFLAAVAVGGLVFLGAVLALVGVGAWEFYRLAGRKRARPRTVPGIGLALLFPILFYLAPASPLTIPGLVVIGVIGVALVQLLDGDADEALGSVSLTVYGAAYVGLLFGHFVLIREISRVVPGMPYWWGAALVGLTVLLAWLNDSAAYVIGRRWGRHKLIPRVSPGKTIEGAAGALVVTVLIAVGVVLAAGSRMPLLAPADALAIGVLVAVAGPVGDLVESSFKRDAGVKDASELIPGHGGVLDRFDSLMAVAPAVWYYLRIVVL